MGVFALERRDLVEHAAAIARRPPREARGLTHAADHGAAAHRCPAHRRCRRRCLPAVATRGWRVSRAGARRTWPRRPISLAIRTSRTRRRDGQLVPACHPRREKFALIGDLGVCVPEDADGSVEFGISIAPRFQGDGYAGEALHALFGWVFQTMGRHRIHASVDPRNLASMAMLRSLGMRQEAHFRESLRLARRVGRRRDLRRCSRASGAVDHRKRDRRACRVGLPDQRLPGTLAKRVTPDRQKRN